MKKWLIILALVIFLVWTTVYYIGLTKWIGAPVGLPEKIQFGIMTRSWMPFDGIESMRVIDPMSCYVKRDRGMVEVTLDGLYGNWIFEVFTNRRREFQ